MTMQARPQAPQQVNEKEPRRVKYRARMMGCVEVHAWYSTLAVTRLGVINAELS